MDLNLTLSPEDAAEIARAMEQEAEVNSAMLQQGAEVKLEIKDDLKDKLGRYIDFEAGGLKLFDVQIKGRPARFLLVPDIAEKTLRLQFQYRY